MAEGVDGASYARSASHAVHRREPLLCNGSAGVSSLTGDEYRTVLWGYPVRTRSDACVSFINDFYRKVRVWMSF